MTDKDLAEVIARYDLRIRRETRPDGSPLYLAWYAEVPGCLVEAAGRTEVLLELDAVIVPFLRGMIEDGADLPVPLAERPHSGPRSFIARLKQLVLGDVRAVLGAQSFATAETEIEKPQQITPSTGDRLIRT